MLKAVIFDLNGIFLQSPKLSDRFAIDYGVKSEVFLPALFEIMEKVRQPGAQPAFSYWEPYFIQWGIGLSEKEFWTYWFGAEVSSEQMINFAKSLREKGVKVFILSNNFKERAEYYGSYPWIHDAVDKVYFSWQTGFVKPDIKAWEFVLIDNNLKPEVCIYFDDQQKNLDASEKVGIKSYMFTTEEELENIVNQYISKD